MCGIIGIFHAPNANETVQKGLSCLEHRGKDHQATHISSDNHHALGHTLHAIINTVPQPLHGNGVLVANCEIYNWKTLAHNTNIRNDAELLLHLLDTQPLTNVLDQLDGDYAFLYWKNNTLIAARDLFGVKPLWYTTENNQFAIASEKKVLAHLGYTTIHELNPRTILTYDLLTKQLTQTQRAFLTITPEHTEDAPAITKTLAQHLTAAVQKRIPQQPFGILFSGGIDSTLITYLCRQANTPFTCYTAVVHDPLFSKAKDHIQAEHVAQTLAFPIKIISVTLKEIEAALPHIIQIIEDTNPIKAAVALPFYFASRAAAKDNIKVLLSGVGSEDLYAGYERHRNSTQPNKECLSGLLKIYERDLYRDDALLMHNTIELRVPFLDKTLADYSLRIPAHYKFNTTQNKIILSDAAKDLGIPTDIAENKRRAAQYGSNFDKALKTLAKQHGHASTSAYLQSLSHQKNLTLGVLFSSGKDSTYALHIMHQQNYNISCLITLKSKNKDSYMFHTPNIDLASYQADALGIPLLIQETNGEEHHELADLKLALQRAQHDYHIDGVVSGALASTYQRDRIEKICDELGLKIFSPLWHKNQEQELHELLAQHYNIIISSVSSDGLGKDWLGKQLTPELIAKLTTLHAKNGINTAGEGGEYESFVLDAPLFKKKIIIEQAEPIMYDTHSGIYNITAVRLEEKS